MLRPGFQVAEHSIIIAALHIFFFVSTLDAPLNPMVLSRSFSLPDSPIGSSVVIQRGKSFPKSLQIKVFMQKPWKKPWKKHGNIL